MTSSITIHGLDELQDKLGRLGSIQVLKPPMHKSTKLIYRETQKYPPARRKRMKWKSARQRRFVMAAIRSGRIQIPYRRRHSGGLAGSWVERVEVRGSTLVGIVGSRISYGPYVQHPSKQAGYHQGNWPTTDDITRKVAKPVQKIFEKAIRKAIND